MPTINAALRGFLVPDKYFTGARPIGEALPENYPFTEYNSRGPGPIKAEDGSLQMVSVGGPMEPLQVELVASSGGSGSPDGLPRVTYQERDPSGSVSYPKLGGTPFNANYVQEVVASADTDKFACGVAAVNASRAIFAWFDGGALFIKSLESYGHAGLTTGTAVEVEGVGGGAYSTSLYAQVAICLGPDGRIYGATRYSEQDSVSSAWRTYLDTFAIDHPDDESLMSARIIGKRRVTWTTTTTENSSGLSIVAYRDGSFHIMVTQFFTPLAELWRTTDLVSLDSVGTAGSVQRLFQGPDFTGYYLETDGSGTVYVSAYDAGDPITGIVANLGAFPGACPSPYGLAIVGWNAGAGTRKAVGFERGGELDGVYCITLALGSFLPGLNTSGEKRCVYLGGAIWSFGGGGSGTQGLVGLRWGGWDVLTVPKNPLSETPPWHGAYSDAYALWGTLSFGDLDAFPVLTDTSGILTYGSDYCKVTVSAVSSYDVEHPHTTQDTTNHCQCRLVADIGTIGIKITLHLTQGPAVAWREYTLEVERTGANTITVSTLYGTDTIVNTAGTFFEVWGLFSPNKEVILASADHPAEPSSLLWEDGSTGASGGSSGVDFDITQVKVEGSTLGNAKIRVLSSWFGTWTDAPQTAETTVIDAACHGMPIVYGAPVALPAAASPWYADDGQLARNGQPEASLHVGPIVTGATWDVLRASDYAGVNCLPDTSASPAIGWRSRENDGSSFAFFSREHFIKGLVGLYVDGCNRPEVTAWYNPAGTGVDLDLTEAPYSSTACQVVGRSIKFWPSSYRFRNEYAGSHIAINTSGSAWRTVKILASSEGWPTSPCILEMDFEADEDNGSIPGNGSYPAVIWRKSGFCLVEVDEAIAAGGTVGDWVGLTLHPPASGTYTYAQLGATCSVFCFGRFLPFSPSWDETWQEEKAPMIEVSGRTGRTVRRKVGESPRVVTIALASAGANLTAVRENNTFGLLYDGDVIGSHGDVGHMMQALMEDLEEGARPCLLVRQDVKDEALGDRLSDPTVLLWGHLDSPVSIENDIGDEGEDEQIRVQTITITEAK